MNKQLVGVALMSAVGGGVCSVAAWSAMVGQNQASAAPSKQDVLTARVANLELEMSRFRDPPADGVQRMPEIGALPSINSRWICPDDDSRCMPVLYKLNKPVESDPPVARAWVSRATFFAAEGCNTTAKT